MAEREQRCETCRFWEWGHAGDKDQGYLGMCHRNPPTFAPREATEDYYGNSVPVLPSQMGLFPLTDEHDWCSEWQSSDPDPIPTR
jgi:hypothetical protein